MARGHGVRRSVMPGLRAVSCVSWQCLHGSPCKINAVLNSQISGLRALVVAYATMTSVRMVKHDTTLKPRLSGQAFSILWSELLLPIATVLLGS
ncbi:unnamed protein product [Merluccius merluccius]